MSKMASKKDAKRLDENLRALFNYVDRVRVEIASLSKSGEGADEFTTIAKQRDGVLEATHDASDRIMDSVEKSNEASDELRGMLTDPAQIAILDRVINCNSVVFEACAFQDLTGQRVNKIAKSIGYVEERVAALRAIWGSSELEAFEAELRDDRSEHEKLLNGPEAKAEAISQDEIDKLFD